MGYFLGLSRSNSSGSLGSLTTTASSSSYSGLLRSSSTSSLTRNLTRLGKGSGLSAATKALGSEEEEAGRWHFLVLDASGIRPRIEASYSKKTNKMQCRHPQGAVLEVVRKRKCGWTTFLGLKSGGWVFDVSPKDSSVRMVEVEICKGAWTFEALGYQQVPVLPHPAADAKKQSKVKLNVKERVAVHTRVRPLSGKGCYLELCDGRGWVLDFADGQRALQQWFPEGGYGNVYQEQPVLSSSDSPKMVSVEELGAPEQGEWEYVVVDPRGLSLRSQPTYDASFKINRRIEEGELVVAHERRCGEGTTFLRLACPQGWVFDRQPGKDARVRMMEAQVERGSWHYRVTAERGVAIRSRCSFSESTKCGKGPLKGALIEVTQRVQVGSTTFLQIKASTESGEERGAWIFDSKAGRQVLDGPLDVEVFPAGFKATVKMEGGVRLRSAPRWAENGLNMNSAETKMLLLQNAKVDLLKVLKIGGQQFAFVSKSGGSIEGWMYMDDLLVSEDRPTPSAARTPSKKVVAQDWALLGSSSGYSRPPPPAASSTLRNADTTPPPALFSELCRGEFDQAPNFEDVQQKPTSSFRTTSVNAWSTPILSN